MDLTDAEDMKRRWQEYTESESESEVAQLCLTLYDLTDGSPPGSAVPGILQARTKLFQILKDDAVKVLHSICHQIGKTQQ